MNAHCIYVECRADEILVRWVVKGIHIPKRSIVHKRGKGRVCRALMRRRGCIGIIDEDPGSRQPSYLAAMEKRHERNGVRLLFDEKRGNCVLVICPRLEEWMLCAAREAKIDVEKHGLTNEPETLHIEMRQKLKSLSSLLNSLSGSQRLRTLTAYLYECLKGMGT